MEIWKSCAAGSRAYLPQVWLLLKVSQGGMGFPESPRVVYEKNPLVQVTCGLRFPPILSIISKEPADFQERVRGRYPLYETGLVMFPFNAQSLASLLPQIQNTLPTVHKFFSEDRNEEIDLSRDFISIATRAYRRWEEFHERIILALDALEATFKPTFYAHVELRYQDVINRSALGLAKTPWSELIHAPVIGLLADPVVGNLITYAQSQTHVKLDSDSTTFVNLVQTLGNQVQLSGNQTVIIGQAGEEQYVIDADFYTSSRRTREQVSTDLGRFNREAGFFFRWAITTKLRDALQPHPLK